MSETATPSGAAELAGILQGYVPRADYEAALESLNQTISERDKHKGDHETAGKRLAELEGKLRALSARKAFDQAADKLKIDPRFRDAAFKLAELPADADEPDQAAVEKHLAAYLKEGGKDFLLPPDAGKERKTLPRDEQGSRGSSVKPNEPDFRVSNKNLRDAMWMRNNQKQLSEATKAGLLVIEDQ
jgi:hypothetical protein